MSADPIGNIEAKRLVIFGAGYVGSAVAREALARGCDVTALTRNPVTAGDLQKLGVHVVVADLATDTWHAAVGRSDWVVNCVSSGGAGSAGYQHSYVDGLRSIQTWLLRSGKVETLVYTSSTSVYPQREGVVSEDAATDDCGKAGLLVQAENTVRAIVHEQLTNRGVVLRLAGIYGPGRHHVLDHLRSTNAPVAGTGQHRLNLIHRDDIVSAIFAALSARALGGHKSTFETFNVVDDRPVAKREVVEWLAREIGRPVPGFSGEPVVGRRADPPDRMISNAKIKAQLGWHPQFPDFKAGYGQILGA